MRRFPIPVLLVALPVAAVLVLPSAARAADHRDAPITHERPPDEVQRHVYTLVANTNGTTEWVFTNWAPDDSER
jgi:hypothetical protein